ncbi:hypothetical protein GGP41_005981 [Bipolaris sorokiniana]|uniref:Uncharacterized protein n=1 Tax=Cochliobolus sativus TaxID=45130 RepID=A0A8H5ZHW3_COCSA|nr:hypothetical protein GGP41_005981 [Bipolaris sorokiniana]
MIKCFSRRSGCPYPISHIHHYPAIARLVPPYSIPLHFADRAFRILGEVSGPDATLLKKASAHAPTPSTGSATSVAFSSTTGPGSRPKTKIGCYIVQ